MTSWPAGWKGESDDISAAASGGVGLHVDDMSVLGAGARQRCPMECGCGLSDRTLGNLTPESAANISKEEFLAHADELKRRIPVATDVEIVFGSIAALSTAVSEDVIEQPGGK